MVDPDPDEDYGPFYVGDVIEVRAESPSLLAEAGLAAERIGRAKCYVVDPYDGALRPIDEVAQRALPSTP